MSKHRWVIHTPVGLFEGDVRDFTDEDFEHAEVLLSNIKRGDSSLTLYGKDGSVFVFPAKVLADSVTCLESVKEEEETGA